jgi:hypothetical protein
VKSVRASFLVHEVGGEEEGEEPEWLSGSGGRNGTRVVSGEWHPPETNTTRACNSELRQSRRKTGTVWTEINVAEAKTTDFSRPSVYKGQKSHLYEGVTSWIEPTIS